MRLTLLIAAVMVPLTACSGGTGDDEPSVNCANEPTADEFVIGLQKPGESGVLDFQLLSATPAPPARGDNEWIMQIRTIAGDAPATGATIFATPFMPKHQHGTPIDVLVEEMPTAGDYKLAPVNLWMPGLWETTIEVSSASGTDLVIFRACIPG